MSELAPINDIHTKIFDDIFNERLSAINKEVLLVVLTDNTPHDALPHLAEQFHVMGNEGWLLVDSDEEKKALIKSAIKIHRYKGTKYALIKVLELLQINGIVEEWFEYNGNPYFFKLILNVSETNLNFERTKLLFELINEYKNERSWLDAVEITLNSFSRQKTAAYFTLQEKIICNSR